MIEFVTGLVFLICAFLSPWLVSNFRNTNGLVFAARKILPGGFVVAALVIWTIGVVKGIVWFMR